MVFFGLSAGLAPRFFWFHLLFYFYYISLSLSLFCVRHSALPHPSHTLALFLLFLGYTHAHIDFIITISVIIDIIHSTSKDKVEDMHIPPTSHDERDIVQIETHAPFLPENGNLSKF